MDSLLIRGHCVRVIDNFACGHRDNLRHHLKSSQLEIFEHDVSNASGLSEIFDGVDWVFHLAALADIVPSIKSPMTYHRANVDGTIAVLEASRLSGVRRFVYAASASCYGIPDKYPTPEVAGADPKYPYALTKWIGEKYVLHWAQTYGLSAVSLRLFNVFGPRHRSNGTYGAMFGVFLAQKLAGRPFTIVGDGTQTRDFTFVSDVVEAFQSAATSSLEGEVFNVGSDGTYSVNHIIKLLQGDAVNVPKRPGEPDCTWADISKIKNQIGWHPKVSLEEGVSELLKHIDSWRGAPVWTPDSIASATTDWFKYLGEDG